MIRDTGLGGINSVVKTLADGCESSGRKYLVISLSKLSDNDMEIALGGNIFSLPLTGSVKGIVTRSINKFFPYISNRLFAKNNTKHLLNYVKSKTNNEFKIFLCGFGAFSLFDSAIDARLNIVSHSINSEMLKSRVPRYLYRTNLKLLSNMIPNKLICVSTAIKNDWLKIIKEAPPSIQVVCNPIIYSKVSLALEADFNKLEFEYFVFCGRISAEKNILAIIDSFIASGVVQKLLIIGSGPNEEEVSNYIKKMNYHERVLMLGYIENPYPYIADAKAVILNSHYEGLPTVALESQMLKTPLIIGECAGAAYDVVPPAYHSYIFHKDNTRKLSELIVQASRGEYEAFEFNTAKWSVDKALEQYEKF